MIEGIQLSVPITSETFLIESGGVRTKEYLFVEESLDTNIQVPECVQWHRDYFSGIGYQCYS